MRTCEKLSETTLKKEVKMLSTQKFSFIHSLIFSVNIFVGSLHAT